MSTITAKKLSVKDKKAIELLNKSIGFTWRNTSMGSGWEFKLYAPFKTRTSIFSDILDEHLYLDMYEGEDDKDEYQEWKDNLYESSLESFKVKVTEKHLDWFREELQRDK